MNLNQVILAITLFIASTHSAPLFAAEQSPQKLGLWERFCINDKIGDACNRAVKSLNHQLSELNERPAVQTSELKLRLQAVSQMGCNIKKQTNCDLNSEALVQAEADEF